MKIDISTLTLKELANATSFLIFQFEDQNGTVELMVDCNDNAFVPLPSGYFLKDENKNISYQFTGLNKIELPDYWIDIEEICGSWKICSPNSDWEFLMDSDDLDYFEEGSGDLSSENRELIISKITNKTLFTLVTEFIEKSS